MMGHHRALLGEAFDMLRFLLHVTQRNEQREIGVLMPGRFEHRVELPLHVFPDAVAPGLDDHAAAHVGLLRQIGGADDLLIPFGKIFLATRADRDYRCLVGQSEAEICAPAETKSPVGGPVS